VPVKGGKRPLTATARHQIALTGSAFLLYSFKVSGSPTAPSIQIAMRPSGASLDASGGFFDRGARFGSSKGWPFELGEGLPKVRPLDGLLVQCEITPRDCLDLITVKTVMPAIFDGVISKKTLIGLTVHCDATARWRLAHVSIPCLVLGRA
jgi:hypothetical protein